MLRKVAPTVRGLQPSASLRCPIFISARFLLAVKMGMGLSHPLRGFEFSIIFRQNKETGSHPSLFWRRTRCSNPEDRINTGLLKFETGEIPFIPFLMDFWYLLPLLEDSLQRHTIQYSRCSHMTLRWILCH